MKVLLYDTILNLVIIQIWTLPDFVPIAGLKADYYKVSLPQLTFGSCR